MTATANKLRNSTLAWLIMSKKEACLKRKGVTNIVPKRMPGVKNPKTMSAIKDPQAGLITWSSEL